MQTTATATSETDENTISHDTTTTISLLDNFITTHTTTISHFSISHTTTTIMGRKQVRAFPWSWDERKPFQLPGRP